MTVAVLIPAFNEAKHIGKVIDDCKPYADKIVVCDDGSKDLTMEIAQEHGAQVIRHTPNKGYGYTLQVLFRNAIDYGADISVVVDGDGQHDAKDIPLLLAAIEKGYDVAAGFRDKSQSPTVRKFGLKVLDLASGVEVDSQCGFRAYRTSVLNLLLPTENGMAAGAQILRLAADAHLKVIPVPVDIRYKPDSSTHNMFYHGFDVLLNTIKHTSMRHPLLYYGASGLVALLASVPMWLLDLQDYVLYKTIDVGLTVVAAVLSISGISLASLGILIWILMAVVKEAAR